MKLCLLWTAVVLAVSQLLCPASAQLLMHGKFARDYSVTSFALPPADAGYGVAFVPGNSGLLLLGVCKRGQLLVFTVQRNSAGHISGLLNATSPVYACSDSANCGLAFAPASKAKASTGYRSLLLADEYSGISQLPHPYTTPSVLTVNASSVKALAFVPSSWPGAGILALGQLGTPEPLYAQDYSLTNNGVVKPEGYSASLGTLAIEANDIAYGPISAPLLPKYALLTVQGYDSGDVYVYTANGQGAVTDSNPELFASTEHSQDVDSLAFDPATCDLLVLAGADAVLYVITGFVAAGSSCHI
jgi:hypothetical protein